MGWWPWRWSILRERLRSVAKKTTRRSRRRKPAQRKRAWLLPLLLKLSLVGLVLLAVYVVYLDTLITSTFDERKWQIPARVYARPLELFPGAMLSVEDLEHELDLLGYRQVSAVRSPGQRSRNGSRFDIYTRGFAFAEDPEPARRLQLELRNGQVNLLRGGEGDVGLMRLEPVHIGGIYPSHGEDRLLVRLQDVPPEMIAALIAVEDRAFYKHHGISLRGIARALWSNLRSGQVVAGGSTITQQLVKNYYLTPQRNLWRKVREALMAVLLEFHYSKPQILEAYLNEVYLGQEGPRGLHGVALAARHYFDRPLSELGIHQQALLVGMIKGPSLYNPQRNPERALQRRSVVLQVMAEQGVISAEHATIADAMPLGLQQRVRRRDSWPAYLDLVRRQLRHEYREEDLATQGLSIYTAFDPLVQASLETTIESGMEQLDPGGELETAAVATRPDTGEVVALAGGRQSRYAGFNRALDARRPAGSLFKPAVYLAALEQSQRYTLATQLDDSPLEVTDRAGNIWAPRNFDRRSHGQVPLHRALASSYNQATARLGMELGIETVVDALNRLGIEQTLQPLPALTLGAGAYSPMDLAAVYQTLAAGGFRTPLRSIREVVNADGVPLSRYPVYYDRSVSLQAAHLVQYALREVVQEGTGRGVYRYLEQGFTVAGKTGTTNEGRDAWFAGFSGDLMAVTWIGYDDNRETPFTGATGALPLWARFMAQASHKPLLYRMPDGVEARYVNDDTGLLTDDGCADARLLPFIRGSEPKAGPPCRNTRRPGLRDWFESLFGGK